MRPFLCRFAGVQPKKATDRKLNHAKAISPVTISIGMPKSQLNISTYLLNLVCGKEHKGMAPS